MLLTNMVKTQKQIEAEFIKRMDFNKFMLFSEWTINQIDKNINIH